MANQKELDLLPAGKTLWNTWRRDHAEIQALEPDLHDADLQGFDLHTLISLGPICEVRTCAMSI